MAKTILIKFEGDATGASKAAKTVEKDVAQLGKKTGQVTAQMGTKFEDLETQLNRMGNKFRFMSIAFTMLAVGAVTVGKSFVDAAITMEQAQLKLGVFAASAGEDFNEVNAAAMKLYSTGLIPLQDASEGLANLLATGLGLEKSTKLMETFLNAAVVAKESLTDTFGRAIVKATLGVRIFQERQIDAIGINTRLDIVFREYGKTIGVVSTELTNAQKTQAIYNYYMKEGTRFTGAAQLATETFSGTLSRLQSSTMMMQATMGATLIPLIGSVATAFIKVTRTVANFAEQQPGVTSAIISGSIAFTVLGASLAAVGALVPLVTTGIKVMGITTLATLLPALGMLIVKSALAIAAIGALGYAILYITGLWTKWRNIIADLSNKIAEIIKPVQDATDAITENNASLMKSIESLERNIRLTHRSFMENMAAWAQKHGETIGDLRQQINNLEKDYSTATNDISQSFNDMMSNLSLSHSRKTEDLQRELDEEVSKGIWADQSRIRDLQLRLKRENEDYALASNKNEKIRKDDLAEEKSEYSEKLAKLQAELDKELAMEKKHAAMIVGVRGTTILDEIEKRTRAYSERLEQYNREILALQDTSVAAITTGDALTDLFSLAADEADKASESIKKVEKQTGTWLSRTADIAPTYLGVGSAIYFVVKAYKALKAPATLFTSSTLLGAGRIGLAINAIGTALKSIPIVAAVIAIVVGFSKMLNSANAYNAELDKIFNNYTKNILKIEEEQEAIRASYDAGEISRKKYNDLLAETFVEQDALTAATREFADVVENDVSIWKPDFWTNSLKGMSTWFSSVQSNAQSAMSGIQSNLQNATSTPAFLQSSTFIPKLFQSKSSYPYFQHGGVIPGATNQAVPIIAHGGETVLPAGVAPITVNINNPSVRSDVDIRNIAMMVKDVLSSQQRFRHVT